MDDAIDAEIIMQMLGQITQRGRGGYSCFREGGSRSEGAKSEERVWLVRYVAQGTQDPPRRGITSETGQYHRYMPSPDYLEMSVTGPFKQLDTNFSKSSTF